MKFIPFIILLLLIVASADADIIFRGSGVTPPDQESYTCEDTFYVSSSDGNDSDNGSTPELAWASLAKVNASGASIDAGDCVLFKRGDTWNPTGTTQGLLIPTSGSAGNYITYGAYGTGNKPVFDGTGVNLPTNHGMIRGDSKNYIIVDNIRVQDSGVGDHDGNSGIGFYAGSNITVKYCEVSNTEEGGIKFNTTDNVSVLNNTVTLSNCYGSSEQISLGDVDGFEVAYNTSHTNCNPSYSPPGGAGIDSKQGSKNGTIHHNTVYNIDGGSNGIYVDAYNQDTYNIQVYNNRVDDISGAAGIQIGSEEGGGLHGVLVHNNIVSRATRGGFNMHNSGPYGSDVYDIKFYNNTVYLCGTNGTDYLGGSRIFDVMLISDGDGGRDGLHVKNNIFSNSYYFQIGSSVSATIILDHNVIYGTHTNSGGFTALWGTNYINSNPLFTNAANGDFSIGIGSPAKNACDNSVWQGTPDITDYNGNAITDSNGNIIVSGGTVSCGAIQ